MLQRYWITIIAALSLMVILGACGTPNPQPAGLTPIPTLAPPGKVVLLPAISGAGAPPTTGGGGQANPARGAPIYLQNCSVCHGNQGQGGDGPTLRNNQFVQSGSDQAVYTTVANGRPGTKMPAWLITNGGPLSDSDISNVVAYLHTFQSVSVIASPTPAPEEATETPPPPGESTPEPARPSNTGNPGPGATMAGDAGRGQGGFGQFCAACHGPEGAQGIPNPGSDDGSVPVLNPIDPTVANPDPKTFALNVDLFIEHGSVPSGTNPVIMMPSFGDSKMLTDQQIADIIAYIIRLNGGGK